MIILTIVLILCVGMAGLSWHWGNIEAMGIAVMSAAMCVVMGLVRRRSERLHREAIEDLNRYAHKLEKQTRETIQRLSGRD